MLRLAIADQTQARADAKSESKTPSRLRSADDGAFDISGFLDEAHGFVPVFIPITEPAVGVGGALALVFIDKGQSGTRPDISAVGGLKTDNGTDGMFVADSRYWQEGRVQTLAAVIDAGVNLQFYGAGATPREYTLDTRGGVALGKWKIGDSQSWFGVGYAAADTSVRFAPRQAALAIQPALFRGGLRRDRLGARPVGPLRRRAQRQRRRPRHPLRDCTQVRSAHGHRCGARTGGDGLVCAVRQRVVAALTFDRQRVADANSFRDQLEGSGLYSLIAQNAAARSVHRRSRRVAPVATCGRQLQPSPLWCNVHRSEP